MGGGGHFTPGRKAVCKSRTEQDSRVKLFHDSMLRLYGCNRMMACHPFFVEVTLFRAEDKA